MEIRWEYTDLGFPRGDTQRYWRESYSPKNESGALIKGVFIIKALREEKYYLSATNWGVEDLGPFMSLREAKTAAETMIRLNSFPNGWEVG